MSGADRCGCLRGLLGPCEEPAAGAERAAHRRQDLLDSLKDADSEAHYQPAEPDKANRYSFRPEEVSQGYRTWPSLTWLCHVTPMNGLMEKRGEALIDIDRKTLEDRMETYLNPNLEWEAILGLHPGLTTDAARFDAKRARRKVLVAEPYDDSRLRRYALRPFDTRWCYFTPVRPVWNEPRPSPTILALFLNEPLGSSFKSRMP